MITKPSNGLIGLNWNGHCGGMVISGCRDVIGTEEKTNKKKIKTKMYDGKIGMHF